METMILIIFPSIILAIAVVFDLLYKKFPNYLFITLFLTAACAKIYVFGLTGIGVSLASLVAVLAVGLFLYYLRVLGAGDVKLLLVLSILINMSALKILVLSIVWGGLLGLISALLHGKIKQVIWNIKQLIIYRLKPEAKKLHFIPYTVCLFLAWITHLVLKQKGVPSW